MTDIPTTVIEFDRWFTEHSGEWPPALQHLGTFARMSLDYLDQPNENRSLGAIANWETRMKCSYPNCMRLHGGCGCGCGPETRRRKSKPEQPDEAEKFKTALKEILKHDPSFSWQIAKESLGQ